MSAPGALRTAIAVLTAAASITLAVPASSAPPAVTDLGTRTTGAVCDTDPARPKRQLRAMWIASVANIDWPSAKGLSVATQKSEYIAWLDLARQRRFNAVVVQIRPTADAFWPSPYEPWSEWLTGTQGRDPGYDPLAFLVAEAHKRNLEFHAWFNPYRVANHTDRTRLAASHPVRQNPSWAFAYGSKLYYNPGIPTVRKFVEDAMLDAVTKYDIDGVHFDDYFYPYPVSGQTIPDADTYATYGAGFSNIHDWRRNNVNLLVREMDQRIHAAKPHVRFGISPFGIWRNKSTDPLGSDTSGLQSYDAIYADSRTWVKQGWVDYINPQLYWYIGQTNADYAKLIPWWANVVAGTDVQLYAGQAAYKVGTGGAWDDPAELSDHLTLNRAHPGVTGDVYFSAKSVRANKLSSISLLATNHYSRPALVAPHNTGTAPAAPSITGATRTSSGVALTWSGGGTYYAVWRVAGNGTSDPCAFADATNLIATVRGTSYTDTTAGTSTYTYYLTALSRTHQESARSAGRTVTGSSEPWSAVVDNTTSGRFTASANWSTSSWSSQRYGSNYRYATPVSASDAAWWKANIPATGSYRVEVWYPANSGYNSSTPYLVATTTGNQVVRVDQRVNGGRWVSLGSFTLAAGDANVVGVSRWTSTSGYVIADAVRLTKL